jgi:hypothetical protein
MSLPSVSAILSERRITNVAEVSDADHRAILLEAMNRDLPLARAYLHGLAHRADEAPAGRAEWFEHPQSPLGKELIRVHASDAMRQIAEERWCHGKKLTFVNCCGGAVGTPPENVFLEQIRAQNGDTAKPDC